jgi:ABC-type branched-subunit amino acid transport system substrate-binding protein/streptogramin lyase
MGALEADPRIGTEIAAYRIEALLGRGGMSVVYLADDLRLHRKVALKLIAPELAQDKRFRERFLTESELAASLDHPNVVPIYEAGEAGGVLFIAMRYVEGTDLKGLLEDGPLAPEQAVMLTAQVADALDAAHIRGLVHRDVKPSNVLVAPAAGQTGQNHAYLADFGLTRRLTEEGPRFGEGMSLGTPSYVAPEQIEGEEVDGHADLYSLGCLLYECLTGEPPYRGDSDVAILFAHLGEEPPSVHDKHPGLPQEVDPVIARALAKSPDERYASCHELVEEARAALGIGRPARWRTLVLTGLLAATLVAAGLLAFFLARGEGTSGPPATGRLLRIDPADGRITDTIAVSNDASAVATDGRNVWVADHEAGRITRIDATTRRIDVTVQAHGTPTDLALAGGRVVVANGPLDANVAVVGAATAAEENLVSLGPAGMSLAAAHAAAGEGGIWIATGDRRVGRLDPVRGQLVDPTSIPPPADERAEATLSDVAVGLGAIWVLGDPLDRKLWRVDSALGAMATVIPLPFPPSHLATGEGAVWVTSQLDDTLARIDPQTNRVTDVIAVGKGASGVAAGGGAVWVANTIDGTVSRVDPRTLEVETIDVEGSPRDIAVQGAVWVTARVDPVTARGDDSITIGVLAPCEGDQGFFYEESLAGAEVALIRRGATLAGSKPSAGAPGASVAGRKIALALGCGDGSAWRAISEARRLVELAGADIVVGGTTVAEGLAIREYAHRQLGTTFLVPLSLGQTLTLTDAAPNLFRFSTDGAQWMAGIGAHAYHKLGWRRVVVLAEERGYNYTQNAGFVAEFCSLGGSIVREIWVPRSTRNVSPYVAQVPWRGVDGFLLLGEPPVMLGFIDALPQLQGRLSDRVVAGSTLYLPQMAEALGARIAGVVAGVQDPGPGLSNTPAWLAYNADFDRAFPGFAGGGSGPWQLSYFNAVSAALQALATVEGDLSGSQQRFQRALANTELDAPQGHLRLDKRHQAIGPNYLTPYKTNKKGRPDGFRMLRAVENVEQTFNGYFRAGDPPPGKHIECRQGNPPAWTR